MKREIGVGIISTSTSPPIWIRLCWVRFARVIRRAGEEAKVLVWGTCWFLWERRPRREHRLSRRGRRSHRRERRVCGDLLRGQWPLLRKSCRLPICFPTQVRCDMPLHEARKMAGVGTHRSMHAVRAPAGLLISNSTGPQTKEVKRALFSQQGNRRRINENTQDVILALAGTKSMMVCARVVARLQTLGGLALGSGYA